MQQPALGPAPDDVVRLVDRADFPKTLVDVASQPRKAQADTVEPCRAYFEEYFSDAKVLRRWLDVVSPGGGHEPASE